MKILACQIDVPKTATTADRDAHVKRLTTLVSSQVAECGGVDLILLPELSTIEYSKTAFENLNALRENLDGYSVTAFSEVARNCGAFICFGMPRRDDDGSTYISQIVINPQGNLVGHYDKMHTAQFGASMEKPYFRPGRHLLTFEIAGIRAAPIICYDHRFPELTTTLCQNHGVDLILHPVAFYRDSTFQSWHHFSITRAIENQVHLLSLNRAGEMYGDSLFSPPWIEESHQPVKFGRGETCRLLEVDMAYTKEVRQRYSYRQDRVGDYANLPVLP